MPTGIYLNDVSTPESVTLNVGGTKGAVMVDGDYTTYYSAYYMYSKKEVGIDLDQVRSVSGLRLAAYSYYTFATPLVWHLYGGSTWLDEMSVWSSNDNASWTHIMDLIGHEDCPITPYSGYETNIGSFDITFPSSVSARYFKIHAITTLKWGYNKFFTISEVEAFFPLDLIARMECRSVVKPARLGMVRDMEARMEAMSVVSRPDFAPYFQAFMETRSCLGRAHLSQYLIARFESRSVAKPAASVVTRDMVGHMECASAGEFTAFVYRKILHRISQPLGNNLHHVMIEPFGRTKVMTLLQSLGVSAQTRLRISWPCPGMGLSPGDG